MNFKKNIKNPPEWLIVPFLIVFCVVGVFTCEIVHEIKHLFNIEHYNCDKAIVKNNTTIIINKDQLLDLMILGLRAFEIQTVDSCDEKDKNIITIPQTKSAFELTKDLYKSGLLPAYVFTCPSNSSLDENSSPLAK